MLFQLCLAQLLLLVLFNFLRREGIITLKKQLRLKKKIPSPGRQGHVRERINLQASAGEGSWNEQEGRISPPGPPELAADSTRREI